MPHDLNLVASLPPEAAQELGRFLQLAAEAIIMQGYRKTKA